MTPTGPPADVRGLIQVRGESGSVLSGSKCCADLCVEQCLFFNCCVECIDQCGQTAALLLFSHLLNSII